jgi:hypothetical protein
METAQISKESKTMPILIPYGEAVERHLHVAVGACRLLIAPAQGGESGEGAAWVSGTYSDPTDTMPLEVSQVGGEVRISQSYGWAQMAYVFDGPPVLELDLGKAAPYTLSIDTGASEAHIDLGGLPLTHVTLKQGAGKVTVGFSAPNPERMDRLSISSGASAIEMYNLANANFGEMSLEGGAASYKLDFGGTLQRDAHAKVSAAMSATDIAIPATTAAKISSKSLMGGLNIGDGFMKKDGTFWTQAALAGLQPILSVQVTLTMGSLELRTK